MDISLLLFNDCFLKNLLWEDWFSDICGNKNKKVLFHANDFGFFKKKMQQPAWISSCYCDIIQKMIYIYIFVLGVCVCMWWCEGINGLVAIAIKAACVLYLSFNNSCLRKEKEVMTGRY